MHLINPLKLTTMELLEHRANNWLHCLHSLHCCFHCSHCSHCFITVLSFWASGVEGVDGLGVTQWVIPLDFWRTSSAQSRKNLSGIVAMPSGKFLRVWNPFERNPWNELKWKVSGLSREKVSFFQSWADDGLPSKTNPVTKISMMEERIWYSREIGFCPPGTRDTSLGGRCPSWRVRGRKKASNAHPTARGDRCPPNRWVSVGRLPTPSHPPGGPQSHPFGGRVSSRGHFRLGTAGLHPQTRAQAGVAPLLRNGPTWPMGERWKPSDGRRTK